MRILLILILIFPSQIHAKSVISQTIKEYFVIARNVSSLEKAIDRASPIRQDGKVFYGYTDTYVKWNYWWNKSNSSCKLNRVETTVDISYTLPHLKKSFADKRVLSIWKKYYPALVKHENGHAEIAINSALEIEKSLLKMPAYSNCDLLSKKANSKAQKILYRFKPQHENYDRKTKHGKTQGAHLDIYL